MMRRAWRNRCPARRCYENGGIPSRSLHGAARRGPYDDGGGVDAAPAPSAKVLKIVEDIANLTLLEAADMSLLLKKRLRIQNVPVMSMGMNVMHDMWYDPLPLPAAGPPPPPLPRRSLGGSQRILPEEIHLQHGLLRSPSGAAATAASSSSSRSVHAAISESDKYLYQLPSASSDTDSYDNELDDRDHDRDVDRDDDDKFGTGVEEEDRWDDDEVTMPGAKSLSKAQGDGAQTVAAAKKAATPTKKKAPAAKATASNGAPDGSPAPAAVIKKRGGRRPKANEGAVPSFTAPAPDPPPPAKKPAVATKAKARASTTTTKAKPAAAAAKAAA